MAADGHHPRLHSSVGFSHSFLAVEAVLEEWRLTPHAASQRCSLHLGFPSPLSLSVCLSVSFALLPSHTHHHSSSLLVCLRSFFLLFSVPPHPTPPQITLCNSLVSAASFQNKCEEEEEEMRRSCASLCITPPGSSIHLPGVMLAHLR